MTAQQKVVATLVTGIEDLTNEQIVDEIGQLRAALEPGIKLLTEMEKELKDRHPCTDPTGKQGFEIIGKLWRATISHTRAKKTAWKDMAHAIAKKFDWVISGQMLGAHTSKGPKVTLKLHAMKQTRS